MWTVAAFGMVSSLTGGSPPAGWKPPLYYIVSPQNCRLQRAFWSQMIMELWRSNIWQGKETFSDRKTCWNRDDTLSSTNITRNALGLDPVTGWRLMLQVHSQNCQMESPQRLLLQGDQVTLLVARKWQPDKGGSTVHEMPTFSYPFQERPQPQKPWIYSQKGECFWNRYNTAWPLRGEPSSDHSVPTAAMDLS
jgi:hypothetical protein